MSKTSQRRLTSAQKRLKERGPTTSEIALLLAHSGPQLLVDEPAIFWDFVGRCEPAGPRHPEYDALAELVDDYSGAMYELAVAFHDPIQACAGDDSSFENFGMMLLEDFAGVDMPVLHSLSPWRRQLSDGDAAAMVRSVMRDLPAHSQRQAGLWFFASNASPGVDLHCLAVSMSGATLFQTLVDGQWVRARAPRRAAELAVSMAIVDADHGCADLDAATRVGAHVESLIGRPLTTLEDAAMRDVVRDAMDRAKGALARIALEAASAAIALEEHETEAGASLVAPTAAEPVVTGTRPPSPDPGTPPAPAKHGRDAMERELDGTRKLLADALAREQSLGEKLRELRDEARLPQEASPVRAKVSALLDS